MARHYYLGIDCGISTKVTDSIEAHFRGLTLNVPECGEVECEVSSGWIQGHGCVDVWPRGMGYGTPGCCRPELVSHEDTIRDALYQHLFLVSGYRRALFGCDVSDILFGSAEELVDNDWDAMIYADREFPAAPAGRKVRPFCDGYFIVLPNDDRTP